MKRSWLPVVFRLGNRASHGRLLFRSGDAVASFDKKEEIKDQSWCPCLIDWGTGDKSRCRLSHRLSLVSIDYLQLRYWREDCVGEIVCSPRWADCSSRRFGWLLDVVWVCSLSSRVVALTLYSLATHTHIHTHTNNILYIRCLIYSACPNSAVRFFFFHLCLSSLNVNTIARPLFLKWILNKNKHHFLHRWTGWAVPDDAGPNPVDFHESARRERR